jgi:hypothetical protein
VWLLSLLHALVANPSPLRKVIHRLTENLHEPVDKLWKGIAALDLMGLSSSCLIFNRTVMKGAPFGRYLSAEAADSDPPSR